MSLVPDLGTLWAETEVSAPVAGIPRLHLAGHIDNVLSIGARKRLGHAFDYEAPLATDSSGRSAGEIQWPPMGRSGGHQRGDPTAAYGEISMAAVTQIRSNVPEPWHLGSR